MEGGQTGVTGKNVVWSVDRDSLKGLGRVIILLHKMEVQTVQDPTKGLVRCVITHVVCICHVNDFLQAEFLV